MAEQLARLLSANCCCIIIFSEYVDEKIQIIGHVVNIAFILIKDYINPDKKNQCNRTKLSMGIPHFNVVGQVLLTNAYYSEKKIPIMITFNISNVCISAKNLDRELFFMLK